MKKIKVIPKKQRLKAYKYALTDLENGMCIMLAKSVYGSFMSAPWAYWNECRKYFTELKDIEIPKRGFFYKTKRYQILTKAIKLCNK